ncbi:branched-chain amino acid permease, BrnQ_1 [Staphylococcus aureus]|nr:branched-chain amino acid permease, BrnQ_1 [Staphylococcus aureus]
MNKNTWVIGFTLFAMFFGAGNLIFPPNLGLDSGQFFWPAILAFVLTGIGLPLLGVIVGALDKEGYIGALNKISPKFSILFLIIIYLTIGPLFAIPRTASTSFEMTITPIIHSNSSIALFIFTIIYFIVVLYICLNPSKLIDRIGSLLTPLLLITILAMIIKGYLDFSGNSAGKGNEALYHSNFSSFAEGFTQGYLTMDAIAAIAFSMIVVNAVKLTGITKTNQIFKQTLTAGLIAAVALIFIYISLGYIGNHMPVSDMTQLTLPIETSVRIPQNDNTRYVNEIVETISDSEFDEFICPNNKRIGFKRYAYRNDRYSFKRDFKLYECDDCSSCSLRHQCMKPNSKSNKKIMKNYNWEYFKAQINQKLSEPETKKSIVKEKLM